MRKSNARERLLETAGRLFHERGYSGVGINEIIEKAETAKASFYQHFKSKENLCEAWLDSIHGKSEERHQAILDSDACPVDKLKAYFDDLEDYITKSDFRGCPFANTATVTGEDACGILVRVEEHKRFIREFLRNLASQFIEDKDRANSIGDLYFLLYSGATVEAQSLRDIWPVEVARSAAIEIAKCESYSKTGED